MPLVDVVCSKCGDTSELLVRIGEELVCPSCGSSDVEKQLGAPSIGRAGSLSMTSSRPESLPPCRPGCCRLPSQ
ncbi:zinc ribbon domain-containing protein [bacterium]|jgi:putative FmdB family regulatory protein|nr:zinc ribbon domain-containing protein [bacterium]